MTVKNKVESKQTIPELIKEELVETLEPFGPVPPSNKPHAWSDTKSSGDQKTGVVIDGVALEPILKDVKELSVIRDALKKHDVFNSHWGLSSDLIYSVYLFEYPDDKTYCFILANGSYWEGSANKIGRRFPWHEGRTGSRRGEKANQSTIILINSQCIDCRLDGSTSTLFNIDAEDCSFDNAIVNATGAYIPLSHVIPPHRLKLKALTVINAQLIDSEVQGPGSIVNSSLMKTRISAKGSLTIQDSTLEDCQFTAGGHQLTIKNSYIDHSSACTQLSGPLSIQNLSRPPAFNLFVDQLTICNVYDLTTIELMDMKLRLVRKDFSNVYLILEGAATQTFKFLGEEYDTSPWVQSSGIDLRTLIKKMAVEADRNPYNSVIDRDWDSDVNRRFIDFAVGAVTSRLSIITLLHDSARALKNIGGIGIPSVNDDYGSF